MGYDRQQQQQCWNIRSPYISGGYVIFAGSHISGGYVIFAGSEALHTCYRQVPGWCKYYSSSKVSSVEVLVFAPSKSWRVLMAWRGAGRGAPTHSPPQGL